MFESFYSALIAKPFLNFTEAMMTAKELSLKHGLEFYQNKNQILLSHAEGEHKLELIQKAQGWEFFLDLESRTRRLMNLCAQLCMLNAGSEDLSHYLESQLGTLLKETTQVEPSQLYCPLQEELVVSTKESPHRHSSVNSFKALPKVIIPRHTMHVKTYNQSLTGDIRRAIYEHRSQPEGDWPPTESWSQHNPSWPVPKAPLASSSAFPLNPSQAFYMDPFAQGNPLE